MKLNDKVVVVVGSTSGIGKSMAEIFAKEGALSIVTGRREEKGMEVVNAINENGNKADFFKLDATDLAQCTGLIKAVVDKYGKIDVLVYNAGIAPSCNLESTDEKTWDSIYSTNLKSAFFMIQAAVPELAKTKGNIILTGSLAGVSAANSGGNVAYGSGKAAMAHMVKILALQAAKNGIRVNAVSPGVTMTDILANASEQTLAYLKASIPLGIVGQPEDIANLALFLASDDAKFITGQTINVDGGASIG